jgi:hypothetical protein
VSEENKKLYAISIVTGEIFTIEESDVKLLYNYQIPLKTRPKGNCKKCYGRGYVGTDSSTKLYLLCPCITKCTIDGYSSREITIEMPRYS